MPSVLVTGAGRGIGLAITRHIGERGWDVYATARSADDLRDLGRLSHVHPLQLDITDRSAVARLPEQLPTRLDGVVNNAGIIVQGPIETLPLEDLSRQLEVNVTAQIAVVQSVLPQLRQARGRVVFMSSVSGLVTTPGTGAYSASKYALESLADAPRMELRPWRIPVALIEPGPTRTDMWGGALDDYDRMTPGGEEAYTSAAGPTWRNETAARHALAVGLNRPTSHAAKVRCPVLVQIGTADRVVPLNPARWMAAKIARSEIKEYPVDHFDVYAGPWQERLLADQLEFLLRVLR